MNIAYHGHTRTLVYTFTRNGIYNETSYPSGMQVIHLSVTEAIKQQHPGVIAGASSKNSNKYHRDYYGLHNYDKEKKDGLYMISRGLGHKPGTIPNNIYDVPPADPNAPTDLLVIYDEGYGGLTLPENPLSVIWASENCLPDPEIFQTVAHKTFLLLDADVLRRAGAMISRQISWERTVIELIKEIQENPAISYLLDAMALMINFSVDGGVFILTENRKFEAALFLTHGGSEGTTTEKAPGGSEGVFANLAALFVQNMPLRLMQTGMPEEILKHIRSQGIPIFQAIMQNIAQESSDEKYTVMMGIRLRALLEAGESIVLSGFQYDDKRKDMYQLLSELRELYWTPFLIPVEPSPEGLLYVPNDWTITNSVANKQVFDVAFDYVKNGVKVIDGLPHLSLGALNTVDRWEIEEYQNVRNLILDYATGEVTRPLSIAVFGSPGSGKSFGVTQIAKNILPGKVEKLEFNVSQFINLFDLGAAFQKVRDVILEGKLPLVFFDEFDSDKDGIPLGWIKSFLMPMQDGRFRDESGEHPLGKCILVFAGGTASDFDTFIQPLKHGDTAEYQNFKNIKGPDFISRLKGTINVLGPNKKNDEDKNYVLRRALLLRGLCEREKRLNFVSGVAQISPGIIKAMLLVPEYSHGARSMEAILAMSRIEGGTWEPASLPFRSQLALHCDADAFLGLV